MPSSNFIKINPRITAPGPAQTRRQTDRQTKGQKDRQTDRQTDSTKIRITAIVKP